MSDLIEFKFVNNSLTTFSQAKVIAKFASYFKVKQSIFRDALEVESLKNHAIVSFNYRDLPEHVRNFADEFYVASFKLNVREFLSAKTFSKSRFLSEYELMRASIKRGTPHFIVYDKEPYILLNLDNDLVRGGGFLLNYPELQNKILVPIQFWLEEEYPLPSS